MRQNSERIHGVDVLFLLPKGFPYKTFYWVAQAEWRRKMKSFTELLSPLTLSFLLFLSHHFLHSPFRVALLELSHSPFAAAPYTFHSRLASHTLLSLTLTCNTHTLPPPSQFPLSLSLFFLWGCLCAFVCFCSEHSRDTHF